MVHGSISTPIDYIHQSIHPHWELTRSPPLTMVNLTNLSIHSVGFHAAPGEHAQPIVSDVGAPCARRGPCADFPRGGGNAAGCGRGKDAAGWIILIGIAILATTSANSTWRWILSNLLRQSLYNPHIIPYHLYKNSVNVHIKIRFCRSPILAWSCCTTCVSRTTWAPRCAARSCWGLRARCCWAAWRRRWAGVQWLLQGALLVGGLEHQFYFPIYWE